MNRSHCKSVRAKLKKNGGPLATEAADCIEWLLSQVTEKPRGEIHPDHKAIVLLFQDRLNKPQRDKKETSTFNSIKHLITSEDLANLRRFIRQPDPKGFHKLLSARKKTPVTLMRDYINQTDFAAQWCRLNPPAPETESPKIKEPADWRQHAPGRLKDFSWSLVCSQYPDIAQDILKASASEVQSDLKTD